MSSLHTSHRLPGAGLILLCAVSAVIVAGLAGCGSGDPEVPVMGVATVNLGDSPFIAFVALQASPGIAQVHYRIAPQPGSLSRPVDVTYSAAYLTQRGYLAADGSSLTVPVFGLYANFHNVVAIDLTLQDGSVTSVQTEIDTVPYVDPNGIYDRPNILVKRTAGDGLDFDYFVMKSALGNPVVVDTDGQVRWVVPGQANSMSTAFQNNGFVIGDSGAPSVQRLELDGTSRSVQLDASGLTDFHHNIDVGKQGLLGEFDGVANGVKIVESTLADFDPATGEIFKQWEMGDILTRYMQGQGDDPALFVRPGTDWFHMNSAIYDPADDTLIVSSRENFVMKIDYDSGDLIWLLGDPTKYWHGFPSLAAKSLSLAAGGLAPIGQHALSITADGTLLLFNDGLGSIDEPAGAPAGVTRTFSAVSGYAIDGAAQTASESFDFNDGQQIFSSVCSSAYKSASGGSMLVDFATADAGGQARLMGVVGSGQVAFDFSYKTLGCNTAWNAEPVPFEAMRFN